MGAINESLYLVVAMTVGCMSGTYDDTVQRTSDLNHPQDKAITGAVYRMSRTCSAGGVGYPNRSLDNKKGAVNALLFERSLPIFDSLRPSGREDVASLRQYYGAWDKRVVSIFPAQATFNEDTGEFRVDTTEPHNSVLSISVRARVLKGERGALATVTEQLASSSSSTTDTLSKTGVLILEDPETWFARHRALYSCAHEVLEEIKP